MNFKEYFYKIVKEDFPSEPSEFEKLYSILEPYGNIRIAFSDAPRIQPMKRPPPKTERHWTGFGVKPKGLWYAWGEEWLRYMQYEMNKDKILDYSYIHALEINPKEVIIINTEKQFLDFHNKYVDPKLNEINWPAVYSIAKGIEINPIQYKYRRSQEYNWYGSWDLVSGCIWDTTAIVSSQVVYSE